MEQPLAWPEGSLSPPGVEVAEQAPDRPRRGVSAWAVQALSGLPLADA